MHRLIAKGKTSFTARRESLPRRTGALPDYAVALVLLFVPFHAFLTVSGAHLGANYTLIRLLPECVLLLIVGWLLFSKSVKPAWRSLQQHKLAWLPASYLLVNLIYFMGTSIFGTMDVQVAAYSLLLNTRHVVWFWLVYAVALQSDWLHRHWQRLIVFPLGIVSVFALLQFFVLPPDFLSHFGYQTGVTITPVQTINQDTLTIRAQSTLRGPNPLGAYLVLGIGLLWVAMLKISGRYLLLLLAAGAMLVSFSRSAWLGLLVTMTVWLGAKRGFMKGARVVLPFALGVFALLVSALFLLQANQGFKNAVLHVNDQSTAEQTSNEDRLSALRIGIKDVVSEPFGRGLGTAGPASMLEDDIPARISENYFLGLGQEIGWLGMGLFVTVCYRLGRSLYARKEGLARMLFATLAGLTLVNLLSYAWADVTLAYLWWGLAAIGLAWLPTSKKPQKQHA
ncbi:O-antigen ligase family protein [Candidatus Saccharibacteria bacterium]|nr:MAG: O-antigen ligase family protein [Candidatus Saccharibacteria bacterium]